MDGPRLWASHIMEICVSRNSCCSTGLRSMRATKMGERPSSFSPPVELLPVLLENFVELYCPRTIRVVLSVPGMAVAPHQPKCKLLLKSTRLFRFQSLKNTEMNWLLHGRPYRVSPKIPPIIGLPALRSSRSYPKHSFS